MKFWYILRTIIRSEVSKIPGLFIPIKKFLNPSKMDRIVGVDTELVIEGYPRSANTFAVKAFQLSQPQAVRIAHHTHSIGQVLWAIRHGIPTIVLIRNPKDVIASLAIRYIEIRNFEIPLSIAFQEYINFYKPLLHDKHRDEIVAANFDDVINDFGNIIMQTNKKFNTSFTVFKATPENVQKVFESIEKTHLSITGKENVNEIMIARPSQAKKQAKEKVEQAIEFEFAKELKAAEDIWNQFRSYYKI